MRQVILIGGGSTYKPEEEYLSYLKNFVVSFAKHGLRERSWIENLKHRLGKEFQVIRPEMPSRNNAKYTEWEVWFERFFPFLDDEVIIVGYSLGGVFLLKYLAQRDFPARIRGLLLVATPLTDNKPFYELQDFTPPVTLDRVQLQVSRVIVYHSKDDRSVPYRNAEKLKELVPTTELRTFEDRGHFMHNELPELVWDIEEISGGVSSGEIQV